MPSSIQACITHAMFSGARSSAPRWSVVEETGKATACSRGTTSRPPADATAVKLASSRNPRVADGSSASTWPLRGRGKSPPRYAGPSMEATVSARTASPTMRIRRRPAGVTPERRNASSATRSWRAIRRSVQESAVDTGALLTDELVGPQLRHAGAAAQHQRVLAGLGREVPQVGRDEYGGTSCPRVGDHLEGGLDAERIDAVEGLVEQQHRRVVEAGED